MPTELDPSFHQRMQRVESFLAEVSEFADPNTRAVTQEIVQSLMDLHGARLARMIEFCTNLAPNQSPMQAFANDELVASLLLLYELHPTDLVTRLRAALDAIRPERERAGGIAELDEVQDGTVRVLISHPRIS